MSVRVLLGVALVANILIVVLCTGQRTHDTATSESSASTAPYTQTGSTPETDIVTYWPVNCEKNKKCPKNEEFSYCTKSIQRPQYCSKEEECKAKCSKSCCKKGCVCKKNYLRAENGTCIPAEQCPITCGDNEILDSCPAECDSDYCPTEDIKPKPCVTPDVCPPPKCKCGFNHRRIANGSCIHAQDCPVIDCIGPNEEFIHCPPLCPTDDCSQATPTGECPAQFGVILLILPCNPQCRCVKGFWRLNGTCVPYGQCPGVCPDNERYSECIFAECRALNCTQKDQSVACPRIDPTFCNKGCVCVEGYLRNEEGICVLEEECESEVCPDNERYSGCIQGECRALNCTQKDQSVPCPRIDPTFCIEGCVCVEGYLRNEDGICVLEEECESKVCPDNERYSGCIQGECRALNCTQKDQSVPCPRINPTFCIEGCVCVEGYLRNEDGICVLEEECESKVCPDNERYSGCIQGECRALNCTQKDQSVPCPRIDPTFCIEGCVCVEGYLRNEDGICVLEDECETEVCPDNEIYSECVQGECRALNCLQKDMSVPCVDIDQKYCVKGCVCEEGYLRNEDGICVLEDECESEVCPDNEEFVTCMQGVCRAKYCTERGEDVPCPDIPEEECDSGCICKEQFLRDADGSCVPEDQCESEDCPDNEIYSECMQAECRPLDCIDKDQPVTCLGTDITFCRKGCVCEKGYLRNQYGDCILEDECKPPVCPPNEEYSTCAQALCRAVNCTQRFKPIACPSILAGYCEKACVCKYGYLRNADGDCIPEDQCPCEENEVFNNCSKCNSDYCPQSADEELCVPAETCVPACTCRFNYRRALNGTCIPTRECPPFDCSAKPNEEFVACPPYCPSDTCGKPWLERRCPFRIGIILECKPKCQCIDGYGRVNGTCIPFEECPDLCPTNEEYSSCVERTCRPQTCSDRDLAMETCPSCEDTSCQRGCVCQENFYRNDKGVCVSYEECGAEVCPDNEEFVTCMQGVCRAKNCTERGEDVPCPDIPEEECDSGCICKEQFLRAADGSCVPEDQCESKDCPDNEIYSECMQAECRPLDCIDKDQAVTCLGTDITFCRKGCVCEKGYLRNQYGDCILEDECKPPVCPPNEEYSTCVQSLCRALNCTQRFQPIACPRILPGYCEKACVCKYGYLRNADGDCIPEDQCPCEENEVFNNCSKCNSDYCPQSADEELCVPAETCVPACTCRFNYRRALNGTCIPTRECPPFDCSAKPNEEFVACPPYCPSDTCGKPWLERRCPFRIGIILECKPKCQCIDGYGRVNGTCIPFEECPDLCPTNEEYSSCVERTCRPQTCSDRDLAMETCPSCEDTSCQRGCVCQENFYRNDKGVCVSYEECGGPMCPNAHEVYTPDFKECPPNICNSLVARYTCDEDQKVGPGCMCESGYLRLNLTSPCIPICDCPEMEYSFDCLFTT